VDFLSLNNSTSTDATSTQTSRQRRSNALNQVMGGCASAAGAGSVGMQWDWTSGSLAYDHVAFAVLQPASASTWPGYTSPFGWR